MKKASKKFRKANKERSQPAFRQKLGLLEKHSDYVKRARDYNEKKRTLAELQEKAALKNPDEFYFAMEKRSGKDGFVRDRKDEDVDEERGDEGEAPVDEERERALKALKTHDHLYLTMERQREAKKIERLKAETQFVGVARPKHVVFVDTADEAAQFDAATYFDTDPALLNRFYNRPRNQQLEELEFGEPEEVHATKKRRYKELEARIRRKVLLDEMVHTVQVQKNLMDRTAPRTLVTNPTTGKQVYKWQYVRRK